MASAFQNRLVGTIILVALAVIFLPEIIDGEKQRNQDRFEDFPNPPRMGTLMQADKFPIQQVEEAVSRQVEIVDETPIDESGRIPEDTATEEEVLAEVAEPRAGSAEKQMAGPRQLPSGVSQACPQAEPSLQHP